MSGKPEFSRRRFLKASAGTAGAITVPAVLSGCFGDDDNDRNTDRDTDSQEPVTRYASFVFGHGIASGDPLADAVILWTRVTPYDDGSGTSLDLAEVFYEVATDAAMTNVVSAGSVVTDAERDYTVKIDVTGLAANTTYYYRFNGSDGEASVVGTTKTLPEGSVDSVALAVCSCANFAAGRFNVYQEIANSAADAVIHLGDYIYEYGSNEYPTEDAEGRQPEPTAEILTLSQYRHRYAQYRTDDQLQAAHAAKPFICVWDDHELANDTWLNGAENHDDTTEGSFSERRAAALQAYHEWLPIRTGADNSIIYRNFDFGELVRLHMLDTRIVARSEQLSYNDYVTAEGIDSAAFTAAMSATSRTLLGSAQSAWLNNSLASSGARWDVLGQQVLMGRMYIPQELLLLLGQLQATSDSATAAALQQQLLTSLSELATIKGTIAAGYEATLTAEQIARVNTVAPYNLDAWDGYEVARTALFSLIKAAAASRGDVNLVSLAGDTHNAWSSYLYPVNLLTGETDTSPLGVEFATPSVTSPGLEVYAGFGADTTGALQASFEQVITLLVDHLEYLNAGNRGYMLVTFTQESATCEWNFVDTIASTDYGALSAQAKTLQVMAGSVTLSDPNLR